MSPCTGGCSGNRRPVADPFHRPLPGPGRRAADLTKVRLSRAAGYLATTTQNLSAIARRTGYGSEASLSKAFKREYGTSPGDYRRRRATQPIALAGDGRADPGDAGARRSVLHTTPGRPGDRVNGGRRRPVATR
jgi:AraC-like DNA-binding protein